MLSHSRSEWSFRFYLFSAVACTLEKSIVLFVWFRYWCPLSTLRDSDSSSLEQGLGIGILIVSLDNSNVQPGFRALPFLLFHLLFWHKLYAKLPSGSSLWNLKMVFLACVEFGSWKQKSLTFNTTVSHVDFKGLSWKSQTKQWLFFSLCIPTTTIPILPKEDSSDWSGNRHILQRTTTTTKRAPKWTCTDMITPCLLPKPSFPLSTLPLREDSLFDIAPNNR